MPIAPYPVPQPLDHLVDRGDEHAPALILRDGELSYGELRARIALLAGWLASRLGWEVAPLDADAGGRTGALRADGGEVTVALRPVRELAVPGLDGLTLTSRDASSLALDRAPGGLLATRAAPDGRSDRFTVLGASRGEGGVLGEGIRQALLRDATYLPALRAARELVA